MYQIQLRAQASKLAALTTRWPFARVQQPAEARQHTAHRTALAALANSATLGVMLSGAADATERHDPRDPRNW